MLARAHVGHERCMRPSRDRCLQTPCGWPALPGARQQHRIPRPAEVAGRFHRHGRRRRSRQHRPTRLAGHATRSCSRLGLRRAQCTPAAIRGQRRPASAPEQAARRPDAAGRGGRPRGDDHRTHSRIGTASASRASVLHQNRNASGCTDGVCVRPLPVAPGAAGTGTRVGHRARGVDGTWARCVAACGDTRDAWRRTPGSADTGAQPRRVPFPCARRQSRGAAPRRRSEPHARGHGDASPAAAATRASPTGAAECTRCPRLRRAPRTYRKSRWRRCSWQARPRHGATLPHE